MKTHKTCTICEQVKPKHAFSRSDTQIHLLEYCTDCQKKQTENVCLYNASQFAIDMVPPLYADDLLLAGLVFFKKGKYHLLAEAIYRKTIKFRYPPIEPSGFVLAIGKYGEKRKRVTEDIARKLVSEGACVGEGNALRHLYAGKELAEHVLIRDEYQCHYCKKTADRITFLTPRSQGGLLSPVNSVAVCPSCKEIHGENLYFFKWLNVSVADMENPMNQKNTYIMWDKEKQTQFRISKEAAHTLIQEEMADTIGEKTIHIRYNQKEFWDFIRTRDNWNCHYCHKYGDTVDHVLPKSKGGMSTPLNCVCACSKCNEKKNSLEKDEFLTRKKRN